MMSNDERKQVFWLLKKYSSYTSWAALAGAWREFVEAWRFALSHADHSDQELSRWWTEHYKFFLDGLIAFEKGLVLLKRGDKSVFRATSTGFFTKTLGPMSSAQHYMDPEEYVYDWAVNRDGMFRAMERVMELEKAIGPVFELPGEEAVAPLRANDTPNADDRCGLPPLLPEVPAPTDMVTFSGVEVPRDGIWEPEWRGITELIPVLRGDSLILDTGCMNYLVAGSRAPLYRDDMNDPPFAVTWRLVWEDTRYRDGQIPEEEGEYLATGAVG